MKLNSLERFITEIRKIWGPLNSDLIEKSQSLLEDLAKSSPTEPWLAELQKNIPGSQELYRDPNHGFMLLAHTEKEGLYRAPHDHGACWVIYAVQQGEMEMSTYSPIGHDDKSRIVKREIYQVKAGQSRVYLPGDIHDTKCLSSSVLMLRLTSCDLKIELTEGRMNRYAKKI